MKLYLVPIDNYKLQQYRTDSSFPCLGIKYGDNQHIQVMLIKQGDIIISIAEICTALLLENNTKFDMYVFYKFISELDNIKIFQVGIIGIPENQKTLLDHTIHEFENYQVHNVKDYSSLDSILRTL